MDQLLPVTRLTPVLLLLGRAGCRAALAGVSVSERHLSAALGLQFAGGITITGCVWDAASSLTRQFLSKDHRNELTLLFCGKLGCGFLPSDVIRTVGLFVLRCEEELEGEQKPRKSFGQMISEKGKILCTSISWG